ncbi:MAG: hypothetical protein J7M16_01500 [Anaerolineae bacterium]|nr:hypothetical protein [Anaerolineae bacterium]
MLATLSKIKRLEEYLSLTSGKPETKVWDLALDKLLAREIARLKADMTRLEAELAEFERRYGQTSAEFYAQFERGELGDSADFMEWSATYEMVQNLRARLAVLSGEKAEEQ